MSEQTELSQHRRSQSLDERISARSNKIIFALGKN